MKPRIILAHTTLPDGSVLELHEHDSRHYLHLHGQQLSGTSSRLGEEELAKVGTHPYRPARQPKIWILGLGLGGLVNAVCGVLTQKKGQFHVYEPLRPLTTWQKKYFPEGSLFKDPRCTLHHELTPSSLAREQGSVHAILLHVDSCPVEKGKMLIDDKRWLGAARDALQSGGILGITALRPVPGLFMKLRRAGFDVAEHFIESNVEGKKPRRNPIWLARKASYEEK